MKNKKLEHLRMLAETDFDGACVWAEHNMPAMGSFFSAWSKHCGAPREVFIGHTVRMLIDLESE